MNSMGKLSAIILSTLAVIVVFPEAALAAKFDIQAGVAAATGPIIQILKEYWGKMLVVVSVIAVFFGRGDRNKQGKNTKGGKE